MGTPQDRLKKTIQALASNVNSDFVDVIHRKVTRRAKVQYGDFRETKKDILDGKKKTDNISFLDMETPFISEGDPVEHDGLKYHVEFYSPVVSGVYKVYAIASTRFASSGQVKVK